MKSELFEAEKSLLADKELAAKWSGSCATQASEWEKSTETSVGPKRHRQRERQPRWRRESKCRKRFDNLRHEVKERKRYR